MRVGLSLCAGTSDSHSEPREQEQEKQQYLAMRLQLVTWCRSMRTCQWWGGKRKLWSPSLLVWWSGGLSVGGELVHARKCPVSWGLFEKFVSCRLSVLGLLFFGVCFVLNKPFTGKYGGVKRVFYSSFKMPAIAGVGCWIS